MTLWPLLLGLPIFLTCYLSGTRPKMLICCQAMSFRAHPKRCGGFARRSIHTTHAWLIGREGIRLDVRSAPAEERFLGRRTSSRFGLNSQRSGTTTVTKESTPRR